MARGRMLSKSISTSTKFNRELPGISGNLLEFSQLLFCMLQPHADDFGRLDGDPLVVKAQLLPLSKRSERHFSKALEVLHDVGLIIWYEVDGKMYIQINKFEEHQPGLHKRTRSRFPDIPGNSGKFPASRARAELNRTEQNGTEGEGSEQSSSPPPPPVFVGKNLSVSPDMHASLSAVYHPDLCLQEYPKADLWLTANPKKRRKNYLSMLRNWMEKAATRGGGNGGGPPPPKKPPECARCVKGVGRYFSPRLAGKVCDPCQGEMIAAGDWDGA